MCYLEAIYNTQEIKYLPQEINLQNHLFYNSLQIFKHIYERSYNVTVMHYILKANTTTAFILQLI